jgi:microcin C transport system permease protein
MSAGIPRPRRPCRATVGRHGTPPLSPNQRAWARFKRNRLGYISLWIFGRAAAAGTFAELAATTGRWSRASTASGTAGLQQPAEKALGGDFGTPPTGRTRFIGELLAKPGNWALFTLNPHSADSLDYFDPAPPPANPNAATGWAPTAKGRDMLARLIYGFRVSVWFAWR